MVANLRWEWFAPALLLMSVARAQQASVPLDNVKSRYAPVIVAPVQPLALSPDGFRLYAINQGGARLALFNTLTMQRLAEVPTGPGPVAVVPRPGTKEVWLVDALSNSISVIDGTNGVILRSIRVGAEPYGLAFAPLGDRAYVACAGADRVDVVSTSSYAVANSIAVPIKSPRAVAFHKDRAYVVPLLSGNNTTVRGRGPGSLAMIPAEVSSLSAFPAVASLPDRDLIAIQLRPNLVKDHVVLAATRSGLGNVLFNVRQEPGTGRMWIPHTDALNAVHKGEANFVGGQVVRNRISVVDVQNGGAPLVIDLDALAPGAFARCAQPTGLCFDPVRPRVYVCGYGTDRVAVLDVFGNQVTWAGHIEISPKPFSPPTAGPRDCAVSLDGKYLFILNSIDNTLSRVDLTQLPAQPGFVVQTPPAKPIGYDPIGRGVQRGVSNANNARLSPSQTSACTSCHVDGHLDGLIWDLSRFADPEGTPNAQLQFGTDVKGPLATQSLRGLASTSPYHWRGERRELAQFQDTLTQLLEGAPLSDKELGYLMDYMLEFHYPSNPNQALDRSLSPQEQLGADLFMNKPVLGSATCSTCHALPFGTSGEIVAIFADELAPTIEVPQLLGVGQKVGLPFAIGGDFGTRPEVGPGLTHGGVRATLQEVALQELISQPGVQKFALTPAEAGAIAAFLRALDTGLAPATAFQVTANASNAARVEAVELAFLLQQAQAGHCDVIFRRGRTLVHGVPFFESGLLDPASGRFLAAAAGMAPIDPRDLILAARKGIPVTFIGLPLLLGRPMAIDRDLDQLLDHDELFHGTDLEDGDSDDDSFPDGYEVAHGTDPLAKNASVPDNQTPFLIGAPRIVYTTQSSIKLEFETSEPVSAEVYVDDALFDDLPVTFGFDDHFSFVIRELEPAKTYTIRLDLRDPSSNASSVELSQSTRPRAFPDPAQIEGIALSLSTSTLVASVSLRQGALPAHQGYVIKARVFVVTASGALVMIDPSATATTDATGAANFAVPLGTAPLGMLVFAVHDVDAPPGQASWAVGLSSQTVALLPY